MGLPQFHPSVLSPANPSQRECKSYGVLNIVVEAEANHWSRSKHLNHSQEVAFVVDLLPEPGCLSERRLGRCNGGPFKAGRSMHREHE